MLRVRSGFLSDFRLRLLLLAAAAIAPFALFIAYQAVDIKQRRIVEALQRAQQLARLGVDGYEETIAEATQLLSVMARSSIVKSGTTAQCESYLSDLGDARRWSAGLWIVDVNGRVRCTNVPGGLGINLAGREEYTAAISNDGVLVSDLFFGAKTGQPLAVATLRVAAEDGRFELISATIDLSWFNRIARTLAERSDTTVLLLDSRGVALAGVSASKDLVGRDLSQIPGISALLQETDGSAEAAGLDGRPAFLGYTKIAGSQLRLVVSYDRDAVLANHRRGTLQAVVISLGVCALIVLLIYRLGNRIFVHPLRELNSLLQVTLRSMEQGMIVVAKDGTLPICNARAIELLDLPPAFASSRPTTAEVIAHQVATGDFSNLPTEDRDRILKLASELTPGVYERRRANGKVIEVHTSVLEDGGYVRTYSDVTARKDAEVRLQASEARYRMLADSSTDMIFSLDRDLVRTYVSPASFEILGWRPEELVGQASIAMIHPDDAEHVAEVLASVLAGLERTSLTNRIQHRNSAWVWVEAELRLLRDDVTGEPRGIQGSLRDITARKLAEEQLATANEQLERLVLLDGLTGLSNRRHLDTTFEREFARARRSMSSLAVLLIDVDHFKAFNDHYGHLEGDACLQRVASVIKAQAKRPVDFVARYGGEEIAVLLPDTNLAGASDVAQMMCDAVRDRRIEHAGSMYGLVTVSIGVSAIVPMDKDQPGQLLDQADQALYRAKASGRDRIEDYCPAREANRTAA